MKVDVLCSSVNHPVWPYLSKWRERQLQDHNITLIRDRTEAAGGDILFLVSCQQIIDAGVRARYRKTLVLHASDLPLGRGMSPHVWQILEGRNEFAVTLLEAEDEVDTGAVWSQRWISLAGHELCDEINDLLFIAELDLIDEVLARFESITPQPQDSRTPTWYSRRNSNSSRIDPERSIAEQFNLLRVCDPIRYPAFFDHLGCRYIVKLEKVRCE